VAAVIKKCDCHDQRRCTHGWVVRYRVGGRQRERTFLHNQKTIANDFALKVEHDKRAGVFVDPKAGDISLNDYAERWIRQHHGSDNSKRNYAKVLRNHIKPAIGDVSLRRLTREHVRDLLLESRHRAPGRLNHEPPVVPSDGVPLQPGLNVPFAEPDGAADLVSFEPPPAPVLADRAFRHR